MTSPGRTGPFTDADVEPLGRRPPLAERPPVVAVGDAGSGNVPSHLFADDDALGALPFRVGGDGVVLALDPHGAPFSVRVFRPVPTHAVLIGSPRCAQLLAFRMLAVGARIVVGTARPQTWAPLANPAGAAAGCAPGTVVVRKVSAEPVPLGRRTRPLLYIDDAPPYGPPPNLPHGPWTTVLTIREALTRREVPLLDGVDLIAMQPLVAPEVEVLTSVLRLPGIDQRLTRLPDDMLTLAHSTGFRWGHLQPTRVEQKFFGQPRRR